jgi:hypothetical protein
MEDGIDPRIAAEAAAALADEAGAEERTSWDALPIPNDLEPELPSRLHRTDGRSLLYQGKTHSFVGEPESGKTWLALAAAAETLAASQGVMYVDFEDSVKGVARRLRMLGVGLPALRQRFGYVRPDIPFSRGGPAQASLIRTGQRYRPELVILDGVTECMALHGWDINSATDAARFLDWFPRLWEQTGAAVVLIDHVVKDREGQGRWAVGSQHKLAGVNGASYTFKVDEPFGRGRTGSATLGVAKDREGGVREFAEDGGKIAGVFTLEGSADGTVKAWIEPYNAVAALRTFQEKLQDALEGGPLSKSKLKEALGMSRDENLNTALDDLEARGIIRVERGKVGTAHIVSLAK